MSSDNSNSINSQFHNLTTVAYSGCLEMQTHTQTQLVTIN